MATHFQSGLANNTRLSVRGHSELARISVSSQDLTHLSKSAWSSDRKHDFVFNHIQFKEHWQSPICSISNTLQLARLPCLSSMQPLNDRFMPNGVCLLFRHSHPKPACQLPTRLFLKTPSSVWRVISERASICSHNEDSRAWVGLNHCFLESILRQSRGSF
jgi:hypothetical protein